MAFARSDLDAARSPSEIAAARDFLHTALTRERVAKKRVTVMVGRRILKAATARVRAAEQEVNAARGAEEKRLAAQRLEAARDELVSAEHTVSVSAGQQLIHAARQRVADLRYVYNRSHFCVGQIGSIIVAHLDSKSQHAPQVSVGCVCETIIAFDFVRRPLISCSSFVSCLHSNLSTPPPLSKRVANADTVAEVELRHSQLAAAQHKLEKAKKQVTATTGSRILEQARARVAAAKRQLAATVLGSRAHRDAIKRVAVAQVWQQHQMFFAMIGRHHTT